MLIGLVGGAQNGKSTIASRLCSQHQFTLTKFASPLKDALRAMGLNDRMLEGDLKEHPLDMLCGRTPRWAMRSLGTDWGRKMIGEDLWVRLWEFKVSGLLGSGIQHVVVDDVRFLNEANSINEMGGYLVRVIRPRFDTVGGEHSSELEMDKIETQITLHNDATIADLEQTTDQMREGIFILEQNRARMLQQLKLEGNLPL